MTAENRAVTRVAGPLVSMVAPLTSYVLYTKGTTTPKKTRLKKIMWCNRAAGNGFLRIGYLTNAGIPVFTQVLPDIMMIGGGADGELNQADIPLCGNTPDGFAVDLTAATGSNGNIVAQATVGGAAPADVQVKVEIEEE